MQQNPAILIINSLNKKKVDLIRTKLKEESRASLLKLFEILYSRRDSAIEKKELFKKLYGYKHSDEKDYLLRNELRLLRQKLDDLLIKQAVDKELKRNNNFRNKMKLFAYKELDLNDLFSDDYESAIEFANKNLEFNDAIIIQLWALELGYNHKISSLNSYEEKAVFFKSLAEKSIESLEHFAGTSLRLSQYYYSLSGYYFHLSGKGSLNNVLETEYLLQIKDHPLSMHFHYRSLAINSNGKERLMNFIKSFETLAAHSTQTNYIIELEINSLLNISRSLQQTGEYKSAMEYISKAFIDYLPKITHNASNEKLYANYIIALMNVFDYQKALDTLNAFQEKYNKEQYINNWFNIYRIMCYIGLNDLKTVSKLMPVNFSNIPPQHKVYFRLLLCIELYKLNETEHSIREFQNLSNSKLKDEYGKDVECIISLFGIAFMLFEKHRLGTTLLEKDEVKLRNLIHQVESNIVNDINILPLYRWLRRELDLNFRLQDNL